MHVISRPSERASAIALALVLSASGVNAGPCDIYKAGGTPCIAAHGTTRALYDDYNGSLYQVKRDSDGTTTDVKPLSAGGVANAGTQDDFCADTTCVISVIYDQSGNGNDLTQAPPGGAASGPEPDGYDSLASAIGAPVTLDGKKAYGVFISPMHGYRNNNAKETALGDDPESMYAVLDGTHYNEGCCFDYGNAEPSTLDTNNGAMETIYFGLGDGSGHGLGGGSGPWIMADLENGLISGEDYTKNDANPTVTDRFLTAIVKGEPNHWAILGGDATSGSLSSFYDGPRPNADGYNPMRKEGAILLGVGGDNSNRAQGTFYEGVMTAGYPTDDVDNQVQDNIVAAKYATTSLVSGDALNTGDSITLQVTTPNYTDRYLAHTDDVVNTQVISGSSDDGTKSSGTWTVREGLANSDCFSFESSTAGSFIRHRDYELHVDASDSSKQFNEDATFCPQAGLGGSGLSFRSWSIPTRYFRHYDSKGYIGRNGGFNTFDNQASFNDDVTFKVGTGFA